MERCGSQSDEPGFRVSTSPRSHSDDDDAKIAFNTVHHQIPALLRQD